MCVCMYILYLIIHVCVCMYIVYLEIYGGGCRGRGGRLLTAVEYILRVCVLPCVCVGRKVIIYMGNYYLLGNK